MRQHQLVYKALGERMREDIHALSMKTLTPEEWTMMRLHPRGFPTTVTAKEYQPMPGENALWIYLNGQNPEMHYRLTMEATASGDYKVLTIDSGAVGRMFSSASDKKELSKVISTQP